jgi:hypothetical protein
VVWEESVDLAYWVSVSYDTKLTPILESITYHETYILSFLKVGLSCVLLVILGYPLRN